MSHTRIWLLWKRGNNTAVIARKLDISEAEAYKTVNDGLNAIAGNTKLPWNRRKAA